MACKIETIDGVDYLSFKPEGMIVSTRIPVITKGSRENTGVWTWNGDLEKPTLRPSVRTHYTNEKGENVMIHYWLNDGICDCLSDCTDGNAGKYLKLEKQQLNLYIMKQKIVVAFDQEATERQIEIYEKFVRDMQDADAEVESVGGGGVKTGGR